MSACNLIIDSCCDLPAEYVTNHDVTLVKFPYIVDGETFEDDMYQSITAKQFYDLMHIVFFSQKAHTAQAFYENCCRGCRKWRW